jgi:hypothetical protein
MILSQSHISALHALLNSIGQTQMDHALIRQRRARIDGFLLSINFMHLQGTNLKFKMQPTELGHGAMTVKNIEIASSKFQALYVQLVVFPTF